MAVVSSITNARQGNYNVENNNEIQRLTFTVKRTSGTTWWQDNKTLTFNLHYYNDSNVEQTLTQAVQFNFPSGSVGASKSTYVDFTVPHRTDGTQNITYEASIATGTSAGTLHPTGSATLETIPRASSITVSDADIGSGTSIMINKASDNFTTTLSYRALKPDGTYTSWTNIVVKSDFREVYPWTVPTSLYSLIPNNQTIRCEFKAETFSDNTKVGEKTTWATFTATGIPIVNSCYLRAIDSTTANLVGDIRMIRYVSTVQVTVNASPAHNDGSTISSITINGVTANNGVATFTNANTNTYNAVITDSRGYKAYGYCEMIWTDYVPLTCNATIARHQPTDGIININISGNYFNDSFRVWNDTYVANTLTVEYRYKVSGASSWTQDWTSTGLTVTTSGNSYTATADLTGMTYTNSYQFEVRAMDRVYTSTNPISVIGITVSKGQPIFYWRDDFFGVNGDLTVSNGRVYLDEKGIQDYHAAGFIHDQYGNWKHKRNTTSDTWSIQDYNGTSHFVVFPETGDAKFTSMISKNGRLSSPNFDHQYPDNKASARFDIVSSNMDSSGYKPPSDGFVYTYFWDNIGAYDSQLFLPNTNNAHLHFRTRDAGNWQNNWKAIAFTDDVPSVTTGTFTITKSSGNGNIIGTPSYSKYGNIIQLFFQFNSSGGSTSAGSNVFVGSISGISLPQQAEVTGTGYFGSSGYVAVVKSNGDLTIRVISSSLATSNDPHGMPITYICS